MQLNGRVLACRSAQFVHVWCHACIDMCYACVGNVQQLVYMHKQIFHWFPELLVYHIHTGMGISVCSLFIYIVHTVYMSCILLTVLSVSISAGVVIVINDLIILGSDESLSIAQRK